MNLLDSVLWFLMYEIGGVFVVVWFALVGFVMAWFSKSKTIRWMGVGLHYTLGLLLFLTIGAQFVDIDIEAVQAYAFILALLIALPFYIAVSILALAIIETVALLVRHRRKGEVGENM